MLVVIVFVGLSRLVKVATMRLHRAKVKPVAHRSEVVGILSPRGDADRALYRHAGEPGGLGSDPSGRKPAGDPGGRLPRPSPDQSARPGRDEGRPGRTAEPGPAADHGREPATRLCGQLARRAEAAGECLLSERYGFDRLPATAARDPDFWPARAARHRALLRRAAAWTSAGHRSNGIWQVHHAGLDDRLDQSAPSLPHH